MRILFPIWSRTGSPGFWMAFIPVSYTHLDVYKRQTLDDIHPQYLSFEDSKESLKDGKIDAAFIAVSYTHLDVYKRQWRSTWF